MLAPLLLLSLSCAPAWARIGLATRFIEHSAEELEPGRSHPLPAYSLRNAGDVAVDALLWAEPPAEPKAGYAPIPDPSWVRFAPGTLRLEPGSSASSELRLDLPDDPALSGKRFEVSLMARTVGRGTVSAAVRSRLRFSVRTLPCALDPGELVLKTAKPGAFLGIRRKEKVRWRVENRGQEPQDLAGRALPWPAAGLPPAASYEPLQALDWVRLAPERFRLAPGESRDLAGTLAAPAELRGRRVAFRVRLGSPGGGAACGEGAVFVEFE